MDDPRYSGVDKLAPKSHADFAFLQHMVYHMDEAQYVRDVVGGSFMDVRRVSWRNADYMNTSSKVMRLREIADLACGDGRKILVFSFFWIRLKRWRLCSDLYASA